MTEQVSVTAAIAIAMQHIPEIEKYIIATDDATADNDVSVSVSVMSRGELVTLVASLLVMAHSVFGEDPKQLAAEIGVEAYQIIEEKENNE